MNILQEDLKHIVNFDLPYANLREKTVLITGATGLIGASLVRALLAIDGIKILAFVRNEDKAKNTLGDNINMEFIIGDIINPIVVNEKVDFIFHCASVTTSKIMVERPVETLFTSIEGTKNVLELARVKGTKSVVYVSSMEMYGSFNELDHDVIEEDLGYINPLNVRSNYPESKRLCENMCVAYLTEYNVPVKIARLAQTFGAGILPSENRVFAQFARSAIKEENIVLHTNGLSEGNYCYIRDCMTALLTILLKGKDGEAYNVSNPASHITIANMAKMVAEKITGGKINVVFDIPESNTFGYAPDTKMKLNSDKLQKLGWKPEIGLEEAYRRMIKYMNEKNI